MKRVRIIIIISLITTVNLSFAQPYGNGRNERNNQREQRERGPVGLDLSDEQQTKAEALRLNMHKAALPIKNQLGENRAKMRTLTTADNPDMKAINKLIDQNAALRAELEKLRAASHQDFRKLLTEEQRVKFDTRRQRRSQMKGQHPGNRHQQEQFRQQRQFHGRSE